MRYAFVFVLMLAANPIDDFMQPGGRARVIAHRGFSGVAPENTLAAFRKAIDVGADMFELDVLLPGEGVHFLFLAEFDPPVVEDLMLRVGSEADLDRAGAQVGADEKVAVDRAVAELDLGQFDVGVLVLELLEVTL